MAEGRRLGEEGRDGVREEMGLALCAVPRKLRVIELLQSEQ